MFLSRINLLICAVLACAVAIPAAADPPGRGDRAPEFALPSVRDGKILRLSQHRGKVVLLDFWATWCGPCPEHVPHLRKLQNTYGRQGLVVLGVSIDRGSAKEVKEFATRNGMAYPVLHDQQNKTAADYGAATIPLVYLIDKGGVVRYVSLGFQPDNVDRLEAEIKKLL